MVGITQHLLPRGVMLKLGKIQFSVAKNPKQCRHLQNQFEIVIFHDLLFGVTIKATTKRAAEALKNCCQWDMVILEQGGDLVTFSLEVATRDEVVILVQKAIADYESPKF